MSDVRDPEHDQSAPIPNDEPSCHDLVVQDVLSRKAHGLRKYDSLLQPNNGRSFLQDAYEEVLDAAMYLRGRLEEERQAQDGETDPVVAFLRAHRGLVSDSQAVDALIAARNNERAQ